MYASRITRELCLRAVIAIKGKPYMNRNLLNTLKQLIVQYGAEALSDPKRVSAFLADYAVQEPKAERNILVNCLQHGFHTELQKVDAAERPLYKNRFIRRLYDELGTDTALCAGVLDVLEAVLFGEVSETPETALVPSRPAPAPQPAPNNMVRIQGGTFTMGSPSSEIYRDGDEVQHQVTVGAFYMGKYQVTQKEYHAVTGTNPSCFKGDNLPVETVSWFDAIRYCNGKSRAEGLSPAYTVNGKNVTWNRNANGYRLPTEAEWEYACRAGTSGPFNTGNTITAGQANYNSKTTKDVGSYAANAWGLYDMHGNVWEWCWDWYGAYSGAAQTDPPGAASGSGRVLRGGSWSIYAQYLRAARRSYNTPSNRISSFGFRLVRP
jgi:formylglycine-generating enzyme required for sulfatase activity